MSKLDTVLEFLGKVLEKNCIDNLLLPVKVPAGDSYAWVLIQDASLLDAASPLPPIMGVQGANALSNVTKYGGEKKIAALMRPCEIRAAVELSKLGQIDLRNVFLISIDCPGVLPSKVWYGDQKKGQEIYTGVIKEWKSKHVRPTCQTCSSFSMEGTFQDLHIGMLGGEKDILFVPNTPKGESILSTIDVPPPSDEDISEWKDRVKEVAEERSKKRIQAQEELIHTAFGLNKLLAIFSNCIQCHNCRRVCPLCYCRQCYFDSKNVRYSPKDYLERAERQGALRFPPDTLLFHIVRMSHMTLSCVSCGACEDSCPTSLPVSQIFSLVADETQALFNYLPGASIDEPVPLAAYKGEELKEVEYSPNREAISA